MLSCTGRAASRAKETRDRLRVEEGWFHKNDLLLFDRRHQAEDGQLGGIETTQSKSGSYT